MHDLNLLNKITEKHFKVILRNLNPKYVRYYEWYKSKLEPHQSL